VVVVVVVALVQVVVLAVFAQAFSVKLRGAELLLSQYFLFQ
jgi:hypothetical protein